MSNKGIYAAHRLYEECVHVANNMVVECSGDGVEAVFPFDGEMHSMLWYDAIVLTKIDCVGRVFEDKTDFFALLASAVPDDVMHIYGINVEKDVCIVARLR